MSLAASFRMVLSPPHPAARPFLAGGAAALVIGLVVSELADLDRR